MVWHRSNELSQRLATIPGIGVISAAALAASVIEPEPFRSGRQFAASLGLTPLHNCSGGRPLPASAVGGRHDFARPTGEDKAIIG